MGLIDFFRRPAPPALPAPRAKDASGWFGAISPIINASTGQGGAEDPINDVYFQQVRILQRAQLESAYISCGEARRLVEALPGDALAPGIKITDSTDAVEPLKNVMRRADFLGQVRKAASMSRLYGEAFLMPLLWEDGTPPTYEGLSRPLDLSRVTRIARWEVVLGAAAREVTPVERQQDLTGEIPTGNPVIYRVIMARSGVMFGPVDVHASRLIKFSGARVSPRMQVIVTAYLPGESMSILQQGIYALYNWLESGNSNRRAQQQVSEKVLKTSAVPAPDAPLAYVQAIQARWSAFRLGSSTGVQILDAGDGASDPGEDLTRLNFPVSGLAELDDGALTHLAAAYGWPKERLAGLQPTGIINSGASWESAWYAMCEEYREQELRRGMEAAIEIMYAATGGIPDSWALEFGELGHVTPDEAAKVEKTEAETLAIYQDMGLPIAAQIRRSKFGPEAEPPAGLQPATPEEMGLPIVAPSLPLAIRSDPVARAQAQQDAADRVLVALEVDPVSVVDLAARVRRILPDLDPESWPHITLVYLGDGLPDRALPAVRRAADESGPWPATVEGEYVGPLGDNGAVVLYLRRLGLGAQAERLLRALAPHVRAPQFPRFVPHVTLGYLRRPLTDAEVSALEDLSAEVKVSAVCVRAGGAEVLRRGV